MRYPRLKQLLMEGLSPVLYHATGVHHIVDILKSNSFQLTPSVGTSADLWHTKSGKLYFMSFTRHKHGAYTTAHPGFGILKLNGRKLSQNYKGTAIDYWRDPKGEPVPARSQESEDRLFSDKPNIPNAKKYIEEIHVMVDPNDLRWPVIWRNLLILCKKSSIPLYLYEGKNDFMNQNKKNAISLDIKTLKATEKPNYYSSSSVLRILKRDLSPVLELLHTPVGRPLSKEAKKLKDDIAKDYEYELAQIRKKIENSIHNHKTDNLPIINSLVKSMEKMRANSIKELFDKIGEKWA